ncbi:integral inner nuclear membrane protein ima1 [Podospora fimiseda]|uniref:Integral inner nuclear membrane protein ima1 n=1 Tax=Podospora fimiseda TaxID=252190 RepID=A0AAN7BST9_9PEZI|nr:integral inner nuclear membrane protein ima1 [Podospora fimiseda]
MSRLQRTRYLTCFYCGRKTKTPYDGKTRHFECIYCDADNYLDEKGDVADPPVATDKIATPARYTVPRATSPPLSPTITSPIFCNTCLKNQHLLSASLAQYLPDPDDPEYEEAEKNFHRFRQTQERLYPQICAECEPKVRQRLDQAAYTAKTDILRRMIDHNANIRRNIEPSSWLELIDVLGKWLWITGFLLQLVYHVSVVHMLFSKHNGQIGTEAALFVLRVTKPLFSQLPSSAWFLTWSARATIIGAWWNPRFAQMIRGFRRHITGVTRWYIYQVLAVAMRICLQKMGGDLTNPNSDLFHLQIGGHALLAGFAIVLLIGSSSAIHTKVALLLTGPTQPLRFYDTPKQKQPSITPPSTSYSKSEPKKPDAIKSMVDLFDELDEIARSPPCSSPIVPPSPSIIDDKDDSPFFSRRKPLKSNQPPMGYTHTLAAQELTNNLQQLNSLSFSHQHVQQPEEMDWSPTTSSLTPTPQLQQSQFRAFNTQNLRTTQGFNEAPVEPKRGPFWYRVPPAPTTPAQRARNPPNRPLLRISPASNTPEVKFRGPDKTQLVRVETRSQARKRREQEESQTGVTFAEPSFFNKPSGDDPRNDLVDLLGGSFSMDDEQSRKKAEAEGGWFSWGGGGKGKKKQK